MTQEQKEFTVNALRRASWKWSAFSVAKIRARRSRGKYECAECNALFGPKLIEVDHIVPVVPITGWDNLEKYVERHLVTPDQLQVLCKKCHTAKSALENAARREARAKSGEHSLVTCKIDRCEACLRIIVPNLDEYRYYEPFNMKVEDGE